MAPAPMRVAQDHRRGVTSRELRARSTGAPSACRPGRLLVHISGNVRSSSASDWSPGWRDRSHPPDAGGEAAIVIGSDQRRAHGIGMAPAHMGMNGHAWALLAPKPRRSVRARPHRARSQFDEPREDRLVRGQYRPAVLLHPRVRSELRSGRHPNHERRGQPSSSKEARKH